MLSIAGYLDRLSAAPGETVEVKVGSYGAKTYRADLRRIVQGDVNPEGPGYRDEPVPLDLGGERPALAQPIRPGSRVVVRDPGRLLSGLGSFTIATAIWPTASSTPTKTRCWTRRSRSSSRRKPPPFPSSSAGCGSATRGPAA